MKRHLFVLLLALAASGLPRPAAAVTIALAPASPTVNVGDSFSLTLSAAALAGAAVGSWDIDVSFDASRLTLTDVTFSPSLGDVGLGEQSTDVVTGAGSVSLGSTSLLDPVASVSLGSTSLLDPVALAALQGDPVALFTLTFHAIAPGTAGVGIGAAQLTDAFAAALAVGSATGASVEIVPEPALAWLALGLAAGAFARRRRGA